MVNGTRAAAKTAARAIKDCYQEGANAEDWHEERELSEEELSDEGSDYGSGMWRALFHSSTCFS